MNICNIMSIPGVDELRAAAASATKSFVVTTRTPYMLGDRPPTLFSDVMRQLGANNHEIVQ